jgi:hypothetical protein
MLIEGGLLGETHVQFWKGVVGDSPMLLDSVMLLFGL